MAQIKILDLGSYSNEENFITELNESIHVRQLENIIGGYKIVVKYRRDGSIRKIKYVS